jgi:hypothetical protein
MNVGLDLVQGNEAFAGEQHRTVTKNQLASTGAPSDRDPNGTLHVFGVNLVIGAIDVPGGLEQRRVKNIGQSSRLGSWG